MVTRICILAVLILLQKCQTLVPVFMEMTARKLMTITDNKVAAKHGLRNNGIIFVVGAGHQ